MSKFFAMIDGEQRGPFTLEELDDAGVRPDTYVWCKGMETWRKASEVADVCRYWRQRLSGTLPSQLPPQEPTPQPTQDEEVRYLRQVRSFDPEGPEPGVDINLPPRGLMFPAILVTLLCNPISGLVAIYFAYRTSTVWKMAESAAKENDRNAADLRQEAHDSARSAKMWIGITFFLGVILMAFTLFKAI